MITIKKKYKEDWANSPIRDAYMYKRLQIKKKKKTWSSRYKGGLFTLNLWDISITTTATATKKKKEYRDPLHAVCQTACKTINDVTS